MLASAVCSFFWHVDASDQDISYIRSTSRLQHWEKIGILILVTLSVLKCFSTVSYIVKFFIKILVSDFISVHIYNYVTALEIFFFSAGLWVSPSCLHVLHVLRCVWPQNVMHLSTGP